MTVSELTATVAVFTDEAQGASTHPGRVVRPVDHEGAFAPAAMEFTQAGQVVPVLDG